MKINTSIGLNTKCVHTGETPDIQYKGAVSPMYLSTAYNFLDTSFNRYPRYFNTPNQTHLVQKIAALEHAEDALIFSSGMAAISHMFLGLLQKGDHIVVQNVLYGGTLNFITQEFPKYGIEFTITKGFDIEDFKTAIQPNTKLIHFETPSNPLLTITDIKALTKFAATKGILTSIDNTFASPVNQNPIPMGVDLVMHSATKYMGGHSDICAGVIAGSKTHIQQIHQVSKNLGGNLSDITVWMLERSLKTLGIRVKKQTKNALKMAKWLHKHPKIKHVYYPGLPSHKHHKLAKSQMHGFGAMLAFELIEPLDAIHFQKQLQLIKPVISLAGVESTVSSPYLTSHALLSEAERRAIGVSNQLIRFSLGIEDVKDLKNDINHAILAKR